MALSEAEAIYGRIQKCIDDGTYSVATVMQMFEGKQEDEKKRIAAGRRVFYLGIYHKVSETPAPTPACKATREAALAVLAEINATLDAIAGPEHRPTAEEDFLSAVSTVWTQLAMHVCNGNFTPETTMAEIRRLPENEQKDEAKRIAKVIQEMQTDEGAQDLTEQVKLYRSLVLTTLARTERALLEFLQ